MPSATEIRLVSELLKRIADAVDKEDYAYLKELKSVQRTKILSPKYMVKQPAQASSKDKANLPSYLADNEIYNEKYASAQFTKYDTVIELKKYINDTYPKKADVVLLARNFHVPTPKSDDYDATVDRIIDATLGYKLRSRAVRGDHQPVIEKKISDT